MPYLEIKLGPDTLLVPFIGRIDYVMGRLPKADIQLRDMKVSRLHTQVFIDSRGRAFVRDLGSSGGTVLNTTKLRSGAIAPLVMGTKIRIGDAKITFYDQDPPVNATKPPSKSDPRGLIRTNHRERTFHAEATVLAADKVSAETENGPAEAPPEIDPMVFADGPMAPSGAQPAAPSAGARPVPGKPPVQTQKPAPKKRDTGIVEAPWESADSNRGQAAKGDKRVTIPPPTRGGAKPPAGKVPPPMQSAEIDETGQFHEAMPAPGAPTMYVPPPKPPAGKPSPLPPRQAAPAENAGTAAFRNARPAQSPSVRAPESPIAEPEEMEIGDAAAAFVPPPPPPSRPQAVEVEEDRPGTGMPTVKLDRAALLARRAAEEAEAQREESEAPRIPTASVRPDARPAPAPEDEEPAPRIGLAPGERPPAPAMDDLIEDVKGQAEQEVAQKSESGQDVEDSLTDEQIAVYLGGSASGRFDAVDFGEGEPGKSEPDDENEVAIRSKVAAAAQEDLDLDDLPPLPARPTAAPAEPPTTDAGAETAAEPAHVNTSMLGQTTAIREEPVAEITEPVPEYKAADQETETPPPPSRTGAVADQGFRKPHKTRKLMKRRTDKITDRTQSEAAEARPTEMIPPDQPAPGEAVIGGGAKTIFIPKPADARPGRGGKPSAPVDGDDDDTSRAPVQGKKVDELGFGPGGDTVALPPDMMKQLRAELAAKDKPGQPEKPPAKPTIGESPTVKRPPEDGDDEEFILDDNYAFFTPPPPTRKAAAQAAKAAQDDLIDANDFNAEAEKLPPEKRAKQSGDPDTIVD